MTSTTPSEPPAPDRHGGRLAERLGLTDSPTGTADGGPGGVAVAEHPEDPAPAPGNGGLVIAPLKPEPAEPRPGLRQVLRQVLRRVVTRRGTGEVDEDETPPRRPRFGAGAMPWPHLAGRVVLWLVVALVAVAGVVNIFSDPPAPTTVVDGGPEPIPHQGAAEVVAARFVRDWLDDDSPSLTQYLPEGLNPDDLGWPRGEDINVNDTTPVATRLVDDDRIVTVAARTSEGRWLYIDVPLRVRDADSITVAGTPSLVPGPQAGSVPSQRPPNDTNKAKELRPVVEQFLAAVASGGDELDYLIADGADITDFAGTVSFEALDSLTVEPGGPDDEGAAIAVVRWDPQGSGSDATVTSAYRIGLVRERGQWYVESFTTAPLIGPGAQERTATTSTTEQAG
jgi:hypothetical protein